jgi:hypothetical protein
VAGEVVVVLVELDVLGCQEHEAVVVGEGQAEAGIGAAETTDPVDRVGGCGLGLHGLQEPPEIAVAEGPHQVVLVLEVVVDGGGGVLDGLGYSSHGDRLVAFPREQVPGRVQDLVADLLFFPFSPLRDSHDPPGLLTPWAMITTLIMETKFHPAPRFFSRGADARVPSRPPPRLPPYRAGARLTGEPTGTPCPRY